MFLYLTRFWFKCSGYHTASTKFQYKGIFTETPASLSNWTSFASKFKLNRFNKEFNNPKKTNVLYNTICCQCLWKQCFGCGKRVEAWDRSHKLIVWHLEPVWILRNATVVIVLTHEILAVLTHSANMTCVWKQTYTPCPDSAHWAKHQFWMCLCCVLCFPTIRLQRKNCAFIIMICNKNLRTHEANPTNISIALWHWASVCLCWPYLFRCNKPVLVTWNKLPESAGKKGTALKQHSGLMVWWMIRHKTLQKTGRQIAPERRRTSAPF